MMLKVGLESAEAKCGVKLVKSELKLPVLGLSDIAPPH
jgi:hypothetical protein